MEEGSGHFAGFCIILHQNEIHQQLGTYKCLGEYSFEGKGFELIPLNMASQKHFGCFSENFLGFLNYGVVGEKTPMDTIDLHTS